MSKFELLSSWNHKLNTENEFRTTEKPQKSPQKIKQFKNALEDSNKKKNFVSSKFNKIPKKYQGENIKENHDEENSKLFSNCNCVGKYPFNNTESITIANNNTNENNNIINTNYTTERKIFEITNTKSDNTKTNIQNSDKNQNIKSKKDKLILEILNSWNLPIGLQLQIDQYGLKNSLRNKKDKITYFGYQTEEELEAKPCIDYLLGPKNQEYDEQFIGKHFKIEFHDDTKKYYIKDLGKGFGTFIKLIDEIRIKDNMLINIGETFIVFSFNFENENELMIKIFTGDEQTNTYTFSKDNQTCILVGRDSTLCDVVIDDKMLSRVHCCINYKDKEIKNGLSSKNWYLKDGNMKGKKSTNDTWCYAADETEITDKMIFKTNHNLFKCIYN